MESPTLIWLTDVTVFCREIRLSQWKYAPLLQDTYKVEVIIIRSVWSDSDLKNVQMLH